MNGEICRLSYDYALERIICIYAVERINDFYNFLDHCFEQISDEWLSYMKEVEFVYDLGINRDTIVEFIHVVYRRDKNQIKDDIEMYEQLVPKC